MKTNEVYNVRVLAWFVPSSSHEISFKWAIISPCEFSTCSSTWLRNRHDWAIVFVTNCNLSFTYTVDKMLAVLPENLSLCGLYCKHGGLLQQLNVEVSTTGKKWRFSYNAPGTMKPGSFLSSRRRLPSYVTSKPIWNETIPVFMQIFLVVGYTFTFSLFQDFDLSWSHHKKSIEFQAPAVCVSQVVRWLSILGPVEVISGVHCMAVRFSVQFRWSITRCKGLCWQCPLSKPVSHV